MSTVGLVALVLVGLAVLVAAALAWVMRRGAAVPAPTSPRTVADLVRLRAEQADGTAVPDPAVAVVASAPEAETAVAPAVESQPESQPEPVPAIAVPAVVLRKRTPVPAGITGADTPWNRAARMTDGAGVVWATAEPAGSPAVDDWAGWSDGADVDGGEDGDDREHRPTRPEPEFRPMVLPRISPDLVDARLTMPRPEPVADPPPPAAAVEPAVVEQAAPPAAAGPAAIIPDVPEQVSDEAPGPPGTHRAGGDEQPPRARRTSAEVAAEHAAADLALLRTFGCDPSAAGGDAAVALIGAAPPVPAPVPGAEQPVTFRVVGRDGAGVEGADVTLLDDRGRPSACSTADAEGRGEMRAPHPGSYVLVGAAAGHQPGAVAITVTDSAVVAEVPLARSASVSGTVFGVDGPLPGARLTLVQDREIVETAHSGPAGEFRMAELAAGEYGLSVTAPDCEPAAMLLTVPVEADLRHDVKLEAGAGSATSHDVLIGRP